MVDAVVRRAIATAMRGVALLSVVFMLTGCGDNGGTEPGEDDASCFLDVALSGAVNLQIRGSQGACGAIGVYEPGPRTVLLISHVDDSRLKVSFTIHGISEGETGSFSGPDTFLAAERSAVARTGMFGLLNAHQTGGT